MCLGVCKCVFCLAHLNKDLCLGVFAILFMLICELFKNQLEFCLGIIIITDTQNYLADGVRWGVANKHCSTEKNDRIMTRK